MRLTEGRLTFFFTGALNAIKFDDGDCNSPNYHGLSHCMKAVDFIVEFQDYYLFVEIKNPPSENRYSKIEDRYDLVKSLVMKYRDSFLYRFAEQKVDKPIKYICLIETDNATLNVLQNDLRRGLPERGPLNRWKIPLIEMCAVINIDHWKKNFPDWQISKIA